LSSHRKRNKPEVLGFVGLGFDNQDGHRRVTTSEHFLLLGGSEATHERMQDTVIKFDESLKRRGKKLVDTSAEEAADLLRDALDD
jgi:hypothetical protein